LTFSSRWLVRLNPFEQEETEKTEKTKNDKRL